MKQKSCITTETRSARTFPQREVRLGLSRPRRLAVSHSVVTDFHKIAQEFRARTSNFDFAAEEDGESAAALWSHLLKAMAADHYGYGLLFEVPDLAGHC
jgi:hypothetical protein